MDHQFEIQLGHVCNNRCVFCSSGQLSDRKTARPVPLEPILEAISEARAGGARKVTFLGGEPTIHDGFLVALNHAVEVGFEDLVIFTNGTMLAKPGFVDRVIAIGRAEWRVSIQGGDESAHEAVTRRRGSFRRMMTGLRLLRARAQRITANMCLCEENYRSLSRVPALMLRHGVRQLHVDIIRPHSTGERDRDYLRRTMPRYSVMAPCMEAMLERFEAAAPGFDVGIGNLPFCILPNREAWIRHGGERTITSSSDQGGAVEESVDKYAWHAGMRRHTPRCEGCALQSRCSGIYAAYLELHGDEEFRPIVSSV